MQKFTATDLKNRLGDVADEARAAPVVITRNGRPDLVLLSARAFALLQKESDLVWGSAAKRRHAEADYLSTEDSSTLLRKMMGEADGRSVGARPTRRAEPGKTKPAKGRPAQSGRRKIAVAAE